MARIRTIKPEFWTSAQIIECSPMARLLFVGMWNFADDAGRMTYSAKTLKAQIYPSDNLSPDDIARMIDELSSNGLVERYTVDNKQYISITGWHHQKIDRPKPSKIPEPIVETSAMDRREIATDLILPNLKKDAAEASASLPSDQDSDLFRRGREILGKSAGGMVKKLLTAKGGKTNLARAALETAAGKNDPREYIGGIIRNQEIPDSADRKVDPRL